MHIMQLSDVFCDAKMRYVALAHLLLVCRPRGANFNIKNNWNSSQIIEIPVYILSKRFAHKFLRLCQGFFLSHFCFGFFVSHFCLNLLSLSLVYRCSPWIAWAGKCNNNRFNIIKNQVKNERERNQNTKKFSTCMILYNRSIHTHTHTSTKSKCTDSYSLYFPFHLVPVCLRSFAFQFFPTFFQLESISKL